MMTNKTLYLTLAVSIGIHLGILLPLISQQDTLIIYAPTRPVSQLALVVTPMTAQETKETVTDPVESNKPQPVAKPKVADKTLHARESESTATKALGKAEETKSHESNNPVQAKATEQSRENSLNQVAKSTDPQATLDHDMLEYLHSEFRLRFHYPLIARKRGWSGEVVIALNVNHEGMIHDVAIQKSSGYPILDNNAVNTFRAIGLVSPAIQSRINRSHHLSIPVIYKLTGG